MTDVTTDERSLWLALLSASAEAELEAESAEAVAEDLGRAGIDVGAFEQRIRARCDAALAKSPHDWRQKAKHERKRELARRERSKELEAHDVATLRALISSRLASTPGQAQVHHRNLEEASAADLADILADLEFLTSDV